MVASARPWRTAKQYCEMIDADAMVVSNGARIICGNGQTEYGICQESAEHLLGYLKRYPDLRITLETGDAPFCSVVYPIKSNRKGKTVQPQMSEMLE